MHFTCTVVPSNVSVSKNTITDLLFSSSLESADALSQCQSNLPVPARQILRYKSRHRRQIYPVWAKGGLFEPVVDVEGNWIAWVCRTRRQCIFPHEVSMHLNADFQYCIKISGQSNVFVHCGMCGQ